MKKHLNKKVAVLRRALVASALLFMGFMGHQAAAQSSANALKYNAFGMFAGQYQLAYERAVSDRLSIQLSGGIVHRNWEIDWNSGSSTQQDRGFVLVPEVRYYFVQSMQGVYAGVFARYKNGQTTSVDSNGQKVFEANRSAIGGGAILGYQFVISDRLVLDLFAGPQLKAVSTKTTLGDQQEQGGLKGDSNGISGRVGLNIGLAF